MRLEHVTWRSRQAQWLPRSVMKAPNAGNPSENRGMGPSPHRLVHRRPRHIWLPYAQMKTAAPPLAVAARG